MLSETILLTLISELRKEGKGWAITALLKFSASAMGRPCAGLCTWLFHSRASLSIGQARWLSAQLPGSLAKLLSICQPDEVEGKEKQNLLAVLLNGEGETGTQNLGPRLGLDSCKINHLCVSLFPETSIEGKNHSSP